LRPMRPKPLMATRTVIVKLPAGLTSPRYSDFPQQLNCRIAELLIRHPEVRARRQVYAAYASLAACEPPQVGYSRPAYQNTPISGKPEIGGRAPQGDGSGFQTHTFSFSRRWGFRPRLESSCRAPQKERGSGAPEAPVDGLRIRPWPCLTDMPHLSAERCGSGSPDPAPAALRCGGFFRSRSHFRRCRRARSRPL
jgi:hypothetical protein